MNMKYHKKWSLDSILSDKLLIKAKSMSNNLPLLPFGLTGAAS